MATQKHPTGLGRGLGELFQQTTVTADHGDDAPVGDSRYQELPIESITPNPQQPRTVFDEDQLAELAESIREVGLLQPIVVRPVGDDEYELVMGERRFRASKVAGLTTIPAIIRPTEAGDMLRNALLENIHRVQLNPLEEAAAYQQLLSDFGCTQEELALRIQKSRPQISNTIRLLKLPAAVQKRVAAGVLTAGHARALLGLNDPQSMERLAQRIVAEGLSVRAAEEAVTLSERTPEQPGQRTRQPRPENPRALTIAAALSDRYETRVNVEMGAKRGKIVIEFANEEDLDRILGIIDPGLQGSH